MKLVLEADIKKTHIVQKKKKMVSSITCEQPGRLK